MLLRAIIENNLGLSNSDLCKKFDFGLGENAAPVPPPPKWRVKDWKEAYRKKRRDVDVMIAKLRAEIRAKA